MFQITHYDASGHRRRARVTARNVTDAMDQMDAEYGAGLGGSAIRLERRLDLVPVTKKNEAHAPWPHKDGA